MKKYLNADDRGFSSRITADYPRKSAFKIIRVNQRSRNVFRNAQKGITLLELFIAISLLLLVLAAVMSVDIAGQRFFKSTTMQADIQDELQPAMEGMVRNTQLANAIWVNPEHTEVRVKVDDRKTPSDFSDDIRVVYKKSGEDISYGTDRKDIKDSEMPSLEVIAKWIKNDDIFSLSGIFLTIKIIGERTIGGERESATLISGVTLRCRAAR